MNLIKFIIVTTIIAIILGCLFLSNLEFITNYISDTVLSGYDRYDLRVADDNDIKNIKKLNGIIPNIEIVDTSDIVDNVQNVDPNLAPTDLLTTTMTATTIKTDSGKTTPMLQRGHDPNEPIADNRLIIDNEANRDFGIELPWDREVGFCEVLSKTDRDLYQNVRDTTTITFY